MDHGRAGTDGLAQELEVQRVLLERRCPPYARALAQLPAVLAGPSGRYLHAAWEHRRFFAGYGRPLLLLAALRADARAEGPGHPLFAAFAAPSPDPDAVTAPALASALDPSRERLYDTLTSRTVQTNDTSRAVAWLWPAALAGASGGGRPMALADVGASAGLNLVADALPAPWRFDDGTPVPVARGVHATARLGLDASPLDATRPEAADWLRACVWPGDRVREERLEAALAAFAAARTRPDAPVLLPIAAGNVPARLGLLSGAEREALVIAYQTVVRDYLSSGEHAEYVAGMRDWLASHPPGRTLWVELETAPGGGSDLTCALVAHVREAAGEVATLVLARCGPHPEVLVQDAAAVAELERILRGASRERTDDAAVGAAPG
jgi:hypothetical protein